MLLFSEVIRSGACERWALGGGGGFDVVVVAEEEVVSTEVKWESGGVYGGGASGEMMLA